MSEVHNGETIRRKFFIEVSKESYAGVIVPEFWESLASSGSVKWVKEHEVKEILDRRERGETIHYETKPDPKPDPFTRGSQELLVYDE